MNEYFAHVSWCNSDLEQALTDIGVDATPEKIAALRAKVDNHWFSDYLISCGWDYLHDIARDI